MNKVSRIEVFAVGPPRQKVSWSALLGEMHEAMVIVRLTFDNGLQGIAGTSVYNECEFDSALFASCTLVAPFVMGATLDSIESIHKHCFSRYLPMKESAISLFYIALYDAKAKEQHQPLHQLLGAEKDKIPAYASSPLLDDDEAYIRYCRHVMSLGFNIVKIHPYCIYHQDLRLVHQLQRSFAHEPLKLILDVDGCYTLEQSLAMSEVLAKYKWLFFEEPMHDSELLNYQKLKEQSRIDIVPGGTVINDLPIIDFAMGQQCWDRIRFDVTLIGGYTSAKDGLALAQKHQCPAEILSWGFSLTQSANLHLILAISTTHYMEISVLEEGQNFYHFACDNPLIPDNEGYINANNQAGLGVELDWDLIQQYTYQYRDFKN